MALRGMKVLPGARPPVASRPVAIVWLFAGLVVLLLGITMYGSHLLSAGRAFVSAQAVWAKAQKDAVFHLTRFTLEGVPADLEQYDRAMRILERTRAARAEFLGQRVDTKAVHQALNDGGVHPTEIEGLLHLYTWLGDFGPMKYVMSLWVRSDIHVEALQRIAAEVRSGEGIRGER